MCTHFRTPERTFHQTEGAEAIYISNIPLNQLLTEILSTHLAKLHRAFVSFHECKINAEEHCEIILTW